MYTHLFCQPFITLVYLLRTPSRGVSSVATTPAATVVLGCGVVAAIFVFIDTGLEAAGSISNNKL